MAWLILIYKVVVGIVAVDEIYELKDENICIYGEDISIQVIGQLGQSLIREKRVVVMDARSASNNNNNRVQISDTHNSSPF